MGLALRRRQDGNNPFLVCDQCKQPIEDVYAALAVSAGKQDDAGVQCFHKSCFEQFGSSGLISCDLRSYLIWLLVDYGAGEVAGTRGYAQALMVDVPTRR